MIEIENLKGIDFCKTCGSIIQKINKNKICPNCENSKLEKLKLEEFEKIQEKIEKSKLILEEKSKNNPYLISSLNKNKENKCLIYKKFFENKNVRYDHWNDIHYFKDYYPLNKRKLDLKKESELIYESKRNYIIFKNNYIQNYIELFEEIKNSFNFIICVIPSSKKGFEDTSIRILAKDLILKYIHIKNGSNILERVKDVEKNHLAINRRSEQEEKDSIKINDIKLIKNKIVLLLDDITTKSVSFKINRKLLLEKGAKKVICIALAKTVRKF